MRREMNVFWLNAVGKAAFIKLHESGHKVLEGELASNQQWHIFMSSLLRIQFGIDHSFTEAFNEFAILLIVKLHGNTRLGFGPINITADLWPICQKPFDLVSVLFRNLLVKNGCFNILRIHEVIILGTVCIQQLCIVYGVIVDILKVVNQQIIQEFVDVLLMFRILCVVHHALEESAVFAGQV